VSLVNSATGEPITVLDRRIAGEAVAQADGSLRMVTGKFSEITCLVRDNFPSLTGSRVSRIAELDLKVANPRDVTKAAQVVVGTTRLPLVQKIFGGMRRGETLDAVLADRLHKKRAAEVEDVIGVDRRIIQGKNCAFDKVREITVIIVDLVPDTSDFSHSISSEANPALDSTNFVSPLIPSAFVPPIVPAPYARDELDDVMAIINSLPDYKARQLIPYLRQLLGMLSRLDDPYAENPSAPFCQLRML